MTPRRENDALVVVGWREWVCLPSLGIARLKAKVDTGARTSALHAVAVERLGRRRVRFSVYPHQRDTEARVDTEAELVDERLVRSSSGAAELRPVVRTTLELAGQRFECEFTLTDRALLGFRMLLGREAIRRRFLVDPGSSYRCGGRRSSFATPAHPPGAPRRQRSA
jgi:hypothetical protein